MTFEYLLMILGMFVVTYIPRFLPFVALAKVQVPTVVKKWLDLIPASILSAILIPELIVQQSGQVEIFQPKFLVAIPTFFVAVKTKSLAGSVVFGMSIFWIAENVF